LCLTAESSRDPSPKTSRAISTDDIKKPLPSITEASELEKQVLALSDNNEMVQFPPAVSTNGTSKAASPRTYCFGVAQTNRPPASKSNGYLLAETALSSAKSKVGFWLRCPFALKCSSRFPSIRASSAIRQSPLMHHILGASRATVLWNVIIVSKELGVQFRFPCFLTLQWQTMAICFAKTPANFYQTARRHIHSYCCGNLGSD
jgi:hypothetical protein